MKKGITVLCILMAGYMSAQNDSLLHQPFHLSFITPLSTNGLQSYRTVNDFSLGLIYSGSAGVSGLELGGFVNYTHYNVSGLQLAGYANIVREKVDGIQAAGFANITLGDFNGLQLAGFANIGKDGVGAQISGFSNIAASVDGLQLAGFANTAQIVEGAQLSGFINITERLDGFQLGFINIVDTIENGLPIGFLSIVGANGYCKLDLWTDELFHTNLALKLGVPQLYNIFGLGTRFNTNSLQWTSTYGIGTEIRFSRNWSLNPELLFQSFFDDKIFEKGDWSALTQLRPLIQYHFTPGFSLYAGPALKLLIQDDDADHFPSELNSWVLAEKEENEVHRIFWMGVSVGFSFF